MTIKDNLKREKKTNKTRHRDNVIRDNITFIYKEESRNTF
jgi:hypothetical protein